MNSKPAETNLTFYERGSPHQHMRQYADRALACCRLHEATKDDAYLEDAIHWKNKFNAVADYIERTAQ